MGKRSAEEGLQVRGIDEATSHQGGDGGSRELSGAVGPMVPGGPEGGRTQGRVVRVTGRGGVTGTVAGGGARGSTHLIGAGWRKCSYPFSQNP